MLSYFHVSSFCFLQNNSRKIFLDRPTKQILTQMFKDRKKLWSIQWMGTCQIVWRKASRHKNSLGMHKYIVLEYGFWSYAIVFFLWNSEGIGTQCILCEEQYFTYFRGNDNHFAFTEYDELRYVCGRTGVAMGTNLTENWFLWISKNQSLLTCLIPHME